MYKALRETSGKGLDESYYFVYSDNIYAYSSLNDTMYSYDGTKMEAQITSECLTLFLRKMRDALEVADDHSTVEMTEEQYDALIAYVPPPLDQIFVLPSQYNGCLIDEDQF